MRGMTQETTHTPEPWDWRGPWQVLYVDSIYDINGEQVLFVEHEYLGTAWDKSAAARIVACVNACAGFRDPEMVIRWCKTIKIDTNGKPNFGELITIMETQNSEIASLRARVAELENEAGV